MEPKHCSIRTRETEVDKNNKCKSHGNPVDIVPKSDTLTWLVCRACKQPIGWWEDISKTDLSKRKTISEENAKQWV
jgi:hypothetical protein